MAAEAISKDQQAVYDRQLRLWGVQAQQRLLQAKVLVWGLEGSNVELCKNLVLAGVSLSIRDHRKVSKADVNFNYFLREEDMGKSRAEGASVRIQEMNPLNSVAALTAPVPAAPEELAGAVKGFDVVVVSLAVLGWDVEQACVLDAACREASEKTCFFLTLSAGELAFFFSDLHEHEVREQSSPQGGAGSTAKTQEGKEKETVSFPSFRQWLEAATPASSLQQRKADASFVVVALLLAFLRGGGKANAEAAAAFESFCGEGAPGLRVDGYAELRQLFACFFVEPLVHVASVLGGLLSQEVIKAITQRDMPLANSVCFNAHTNAALVERIPAPEPKNDASKKRKLDEQVEEL